MKHKKVIRTLGLIFALAAVLPACNRCYVCTHPTDTDCSVEICGGSNSVEATAVNCTNVLEANPPAKSLVKAYEASGYNCNVK